MRVQKYHIFDKGYIWNPATCSYKNSIYLASIIDDSVNMCDEIVEETKTIPTNFNETNIICETKNFDILLPFLLVTIALLEVVSICCCLMKYKLKEKHLLLYYATNDKLKKNLY